MLLVEEIIDQAYDAALDARGLRCPLPVLKARKALRYLKKGERLALVTSDPKSPQDVHAFCREAGHLLEEVQSTESPYLFYIRKG